MAVRMRQEAGRRTSAERGIKHVKQKKQERGHKQQVREREPEESTRCSLDGTRARPVPKMRQSLPHARFRREG
eukprot:768647-Hanusia_phi.AAC.1